MSHDKTWLIKESRSLRRVLLHRSIITFDPLLKKKKEKVPRCQFIAMSQIADSDTSVKYVHILEKKKQQAISPFYAKSQSPI